GNDPEKSRDEVRDVGIGEAIRRTLAETEGTAAGWTSGADSAEGDSSAQLISPTISLPGEQPGTCGECSKRDGGFVCRVRVRSTRKHARPGLTGDWRTTSCPSSKDGVLRTRAGGI